MAPSPNYNEDWRDEMMRIIEEAEESICGSNGMPPLSKCRRIADRTIEAIENVAIRYSDAEVSQVASVVVWRLIELKFFCGWRQLSR